MIIFHIFPIPTIKYYKLTTITHYCPCTTPTKKHFSSTEKGPSFHIQHTSLNFPRIRQSPCSHSPPIKKPRSLGRMWVPIAGTRALFPRQRDWGSSKRTWVRLTTTKLPRLASATTERGSIMRTPTASMSQGRVGRSSRSIRERSLRFKSFLLVLSNLSSRTRGRNWASISASHM